MDGYNADVTILETPPRRAWSTESKKKAPNREKVMKSLNMDITHESLGILSFNEISSIHPDFEKPEKEKSSFNNTDDLMKKAHELLESNRKKSANVLKMYKTASNDTLKSRASRLNSVESTVCETDLLRGEKSGNSYGRERLSLPSTNRSISDDFDQLSNKVMNTDMSIKDIFAKYLNSSDSSRENIEFDSNMFVPAELAGEKLKADELSWRKKYDLPVSKHDSNFSSSSISNGGKVSLGEFFGGKSDEYSSIFKKISPEKRNPVALVDSSTCKNGFDDASLATLSQIQNVIENEEATPSKLLDIIQNYKKSLSSFSENSLAGINRTSNNDFFKNSNNLSRGTLGNSQSMNCISDVGKLSLPSTNSDKYSRNSITKSLNSITESNKENSNQNTMDKSVTSIRSASSMDSLPSGKLPIECTKGELTWGCVKVGRIAIQDFVVRNRYNHRTRFQISSSNPSYKISSSDPLPTTVILLHPMESRKFTITYTPTNIGAHVGKLSFYPMIKGELQNSQRQVLRMHGYGGYSNVDIQNVSKDSTGKLWLSMGYIEGQSTLVQTFTIKNNGTLPGFAWFSLISKTICSFTNVEIHPPYAVLKPGHSIKISITYAPSKLDYKHITTNFNCGTEVFEIAQIKMISGSEVLRGRLRRLNQRLKDENLQIESMMQQICKHFDEECMPLDLKYFKEGFEATKELKYYLTCKDIALTVEQDPDKTLIPGMDGLESSLFQTLTHNQSNCTLLESANNKTTIDCFTAEPSTIILTPPFKVTDSILFTSESKINLTYDIKLEPEGLIEINSKEGIIRSGETKVLKITCSKKQKKGRQVVRVLILIDNEMLVVDVKVVCNLKQ